MHGLRIKEVDFFHQVTSVAELRGWRWAHFRPARTARGWRTPVSGPLGKGWPDLILCRMKDGRTIAVELKSESGRVDQDQLWVLDVLAGSGVQSYVWTPKDWDEIGRVLT